MVKFFRVKRFKLSNTSVTVSFIKIAVTVGTTTSI